VCLQWLMGWVLSRMGQVNGSGLGRQKEKDFEYSLTIFQYTQKYNLSWEK
jgi:hypothetical protein